MPTARAMQCTLTCLRMVYMALMRSLEIGDRVVVVVDMESGQRFITRCEASDRGDDAALARARVAMSRGRAAPPR